MRKRAGLNIYSYDLSALSCSVSGSGTKEAEGKTAIIGTRII